MFQLKGPSSHWTFLLRRVSDPKGFLKEKTEVSGSGSSLFAFQISLDTDPNPVLEFLKGWIWIRFS